jgi:hypothetical protein
MLGWPSQRRVRTYAGEDVVPTVGSSVAVLGRLALERPGFEIENSAHH